MTSQVSADMDKEFHHVQWAGKAYILSRMEDELADQLTKDGEIYDRVRGICVNEVKKINGIISFDEAVRWQS